MPCSPVPLAAGLVPLLLASGCAGLAAGGAADAGAPVLRTEDRRSILARRMHP